MDKAALTKISYGLYVIGVRDRDWFGGCVIDAFAQVAFDPPRIMYSAEKKNRTTELISKEKEFTVSVLSSSVHPFVISNFGYQSARQTDKWKNVPSELFGELPVLADAAACFRCRLIDERDLGTHMLFYCDLIDAVQSDREPLVYADYQKRLKAAATKEFMEYKRTGKSPLIAPQA